MYTSRSSPSLRNPFNSINYDSVRNICVIMSLALTLIAFMGSRKFLISGMSDKVINGLIVAASVEVVFSIVAFFLHMHRVAYSRHANKDESDDDKTEEDVVAVDVSTVEEPTYDGRGVDQASSRNLDQGQDLNSDDESDGEGISRAIVSTHLSATAAGAAPRRDRSTPRGLNGADYWQQRAAIEDHLAVSPLLIARASSRNLNQGQNLVDSVDKNDDDSDSETTVSSRSSGAAAAAAPRRDRSSRRNFTPDFDTF